MTYMSELEIENCINKATRRCRIGKVKAKHGRLIVGGATGRVVPLRGRGNQFPPMWPSVPNIGTPNTSPVPFYPGLPSPYPQPYTGHPYPFIWQYSTC